MSEQKGFTLVELLVVIVILGIIAGLSIPLIRNIQQSNQDKQYDIYRNSLRYSAKLYVDSYADDLFGKQKSGCAVITYQQLADKGLLKDIAVDDISCNTAWTLVRVVKVDEQYSYYPAIGCGEVQNGNVTISKLLPEGGIDSENCGVNNHTQIGISSRPDDLIRDITNKKTNVYVYLKSPTGVRDNADLQYGFIEESVYLAHKIQFESLDETPDNYLVSGWQKLTFKIPGGNQQTTDIVSGKAVTVISDAVTTPDDKTGVYRLIVKINALENLSGISWRSAIRMGKYVYLEAYQVDNTKPKFNDSSIGSSNDSYHTLTPKLNLKVTDNYSDVSHLKMCIAYDDGTCSTKVKDIRKSDGPYETYDDTKVLSAIPGATYDGSVHTIHVYVADAAGNVEKKDFSYQVAVQYRLIYHSNGGSACTPSSIYRIFANDTSSTWGTLCVPTRSGYVFKGWNTRPDGSGSTITSSTPVTANLNVYAQW